MKLQQRKALLSRLGLFMQGQEEDWERAKQKAFADNSWFIPEFIEASIKAIVQTFLSEEALQQLIDTYQLPQENGPPKKVGIVMAGNIPLVGLHDFICVFLSGHYAHIKPSSKDEALITQLVKKLHEWEPEIKEQVVIQSLLKNCDAYIATGSNNSSRYFEYYFKNHPAIIRRNRTSVAILEGNETREQLEALSDDVYLYFGLGCRNVTKIFVPHGYDFVPLLEVFKKWDHLIHHNKYKNNYDYNLAVHIINNKFYMTNGSIILVEEASSFSPIGQLHYQYYNHKEEIQLNPDELQCTVGAGYLSFGAAQQPGVCDYADGVDTMKFLVALR